MFSTVFIVFPIGNHEARLGEVAKPPPKDPRRELAAAIKKNNKRKMAAVVAKRNLALVATKAKEKIFPKSSKSQITQNWSSLVL
jgi:vacuolar-type H+-ATPase subunit E/Vma4